MGIKIEGYSHNRGLEILKRQHSEEFKEVDKILEEIDIEDYLTKTNEETAKRKSLPDKFSRFEIKNEKQLYKSTIWLSSDFKEYLKENECGYYTPKGTANIRIGPKLYSPKELNTKFKEEFEKYNWHADSIQRTEYTGFLEVDFLKNNVAVEVQLGKYFSVDYDIFVKFPIFHREEKIDCGIEIVPTNYMLSKMNSGPGNFDRIVSNMRMRGEFESDVPTYVIGVGPPTPPLRRTLTLEDDNYEVFGE